MPVCRRSGFPGRLYRCSAVSGSPGAFSAVCGPSVWFCGAPPSAPPPSLSSSSLLPPPSLSSSSLLPQLLLPPSRLQRSAALPVSELLPPSRLIVCGALYNVSFVRWVVRWSSFAWVLTVCSLRVSLVLVLFAFGGAIMAKIQEQSEVIKSRGFSLVVRCVSLLYLRSSSRFSWRSSLVFGGVNYV